MNKTLFIADCEVYAYDWLFVFKNKQTKEYTIIHNDPAAMRDFMDQTDPLLAFFNGKHYDQFILKGVLMGFPPETIKEINDLIILGGVNGWEIPELREGRVFFDQYDLMDDCQVGTSLKSFEGHLGMDIRETTVDFDLNRPLTPEELEEVIHYCIHDVDATDLLDDIRGQYIGNKLVLGKASGIEETKALYMTNAKLTAAYLQAQPPEIPWEDERAYQYPPTLRKEYIPPEVLAFFDRMHDPSIPSALLFQESIEIDVGGCPVKIAYGGIHGAIPTYREEATETRSIRNKDVASYYPHQMTLNGYCSRNIPDPAIYEQTIERRVAAKKSGDKATANALKLVLNTTYGAMLNEYNPLYDPLMGRSVCVSGQLQLLELAVHLIRECPTLKIIQLNTDGIMVSFDNSDEAKWQEITQEWQDRTGFELEEDAIRLICQKDVNNYVEVPFEGEPKIKGVALVRGVLTNGDVDFAALGFPPWDNISGGAFKINNDAVILARAIRDYLAYGTPVEETIGNCDNPLYFQMIAKAGSKYGDALHEIGGKMVKVQKVNRVYAARDPHCGTLYKVNPKTGRAEKQAGLPLRCVVDNDNHLTMEAIDKGWYIRKAKKYCRDFLGIPAPKRHTRKLNKIKKEIIAILEE